MRTHPFSLCAAAIFSLGISANAAVVNLLTDPSFEVATGTFDPAIVPGTQSETDPLTSGTPVVSTFAYGLPLIPSVDAWSGDLVSVVSTHTTTAGTTSPSTVSPFAPGTNANFVRMLTTNNPTSFASPGYQVDLYQIVDVSAYSAEITGGLTVDMSFDFNQAGLFPSGFDVADHVILQVEYFQSNGTFISALAGVYGYDDTTHITDPIDELGSGKLNTDAPADTWTHLAYDNLLIPVGTGYIRSRYAVGRGNNSAIDNNYDLGAVYLDNAALIIDVDEDPPIGLVIPEPARAALLLLGAFGMIARRRRK